MRHSTFYFYLKAFDFYRIIPFWFASGNLIVTGHLFSPPAGSIVDWPQSLISKHLLVKLIFSLR